MIHRKASTKSAISANVGLESNAASTSNNSFTNNVYVQTPYPNNTIKPSTFNERDIELADIPEQDNRNDVKLLVLNTYAKILLDQDVALIANLVSKHTIIVPLNDLKAIIECITGNAVDIIVNDETGCCSAKASPIVKVDFIKITSDSGQVITDLKQYYNREYNELTGKYHLNMKYVVI